MESIGNVTIESVINSLSDGVYLCDLERRIVFKEAVELSGEQVEAFRKVMHHDNNRPVQPQNARMVIK